MINTSDFSSQSDESVVISETVAPRIFTCSAMQDGSTATNSSDVDERPHFQVPSNQILIFEICIAAQLPQAAAGESDNCPM